MAKTELKRGDIIQLKSGSCNMTVSDVETDRTQIVSNPIYLADNIISVEYFYDGEIKKTKFYESQIIKIE